MADQQGRTIQTVGELKSALNGLNDNAKLSLSGSNTGSGASAGDTSMEAGILLEQQSSDRVVFSQGQGRQAT